MTAPNMERLQLSEAVRVASATESISRRLGDELIAAARETVIAYREYLMDTTLSRVARLTAAIGELEKLVGKP